jgi:molybdate transport system substrate-binding protein
MIRRKVVLCTAAALGGLVVSGIAAPAAEVKVLTSVALTAALNEVAPVFEKATGDKLTIVYASPRKCGSACSTARVPT